MTKNKVIDPERIKRIQGACNLFAQGVDMITDGGNDDLAGNLALGLGQAMRGIARDLEGLLEAPQLAGKEGGR